MTMSQRLAKTLRHPVLWLAPATLLALAPKCLLCVVAYAGIGTALGLGGPEICGAPAGGWPESWTLALVAPGAALGLIGFLFAPPAFWRCRGFWSNNSADTSPRKHG